MTYNICSMRLENHTNTRVSKFLDDENGNDVFQLIRESSSGKDLEFLQYLRMIETDMAVKFIKKNLTEEEEHRSDFEAGPVKTAKLFELFHSNHVLWIVRRGKLSNQRHEFVKFDPQVNTSIQLREFVNCLFYEEQAGFIWVAPEDKTWTLKNVLKKVWPFALAAATFYFGQMTQ